ADSFCTALAAFPEREQKILSLYYVDGLTLRAIGAKLGMKANHVSVVKARAMKKLRRELDATRTRRKRVQKHRPRGRRGQ
ncbi:MAG: sigma-70 family RNA polymerase sigma factor, partial [Schwartzia sp.]|nr:sigma-70 family RNA polymerase sigma factor [Schwartzia sp. (in: firmicutes)]